MEITVSSADIAGIVGVIFGMGMHEPPDGAAPFALMVGFACAVYAIE